MTRESRQRGLPAALAAALGFALASPGPAPLRGCDPPPGTYEYYVTWSPDSGLRGCPDREITLSVLMNSSQPVEGLGIGLMIWRTDSVAFNGLVTVKSVSRGDDLPSGWSVFSDRCTDGTNVYVGMLAAPESEGSMASIPEGSARRIAEIVLSTPLIAAPTILGINFRDGGCSSMILNRVVIDGCDVAPTEVNLSSWCPWNCFYAYFLSFSTCYFFRRGDCNNNELVAGTVGDIVFLLNHLFRGGPAPECEVACDANDSGEVDVSDAAYLAQWLFRGGPVPPAPYPDCGPDATPDTPPLLCLDPTCP